MEHHQSWYDYFPWHQELYQYLQNNFAKTILFNGGILPVNSQFETIHHVLAATCVCFFLLLCSLIVHYKLTKNYEVFIIPSGKFSLIIFFELFLELLLGSMSDIIGKSYRKHVPLLGTLGLFILFSNLLGIVPGFIPATDNLNTTLACGLVVFVYFNYYGFKTQGIKHISHMANPFGQAWGWALSPLLFPVELVGVIVRPFSLGIRLAGNMIGDHKVLFAFTGVMPLIFPIPFYILGLLVCVIQTMVFCLLTSVYISLHTTVEQH